MNRLLNTSKYINERFPEQIAIAKLGFGYHQLDKTNLNNLKDIILELPDDAFKYFWNFYFIKPYQHKDKIELSGREKLEFENEFSDNVLNRLVKSDKRIGETT